jgi:hypothetical protein
MFNTKNLYIAVLILCFLGLGVLEYLTPKPVVWKRTYSQDDKIPYGSFLLFELLPQIFEGQTITSSYKTIYELSEIDAIEYNVKDSNDNDKWEKVYDLNFIFLNEKFSPDENETATLLEIAQKGGTFFIASQSFEGVFADTLGVRTSYYNTWALTYNRDSDKRNLQLVHKQLAAKEYTFYEHNVPFVFDDFVRKETVTPSEIRILGKDANNNVNFVYIPYGKGGFYLHTCPLIFTNYNMLKNNNHEYIAAALSYLPQKPVIWDEYYKKGRKEAPNMMRFVLQHESLKYAWWLFLLGVVLFMIFRAKRTQRIIPIMKLPQNTTLEFTQTIGRLYYQKRDDADLAHKKIVYFLAHIRTVFYLNTTQLDQEFIEMLAAKSGYEINKLRRIFGLIADVQRYNSISEIQLLELSRWIDDFYEFST